MEKGEIKISPNIFNADAITAAYITASPEEQQKLWTNEEFFQAFPFMIRSLLSKGGLQKFSSDNRLAFLKNSVEALNSLPWKDDYGSGTPFIPFSGRYYDVAADKLTTVKKIDQARNETSSKFVIANLILLAMSVNNPEGAKDALNEITSLAKNHLAIFTQTISFLFDINSPTRKWIKEKKLDEAIGADWDEAFPEFAFALLYHPTTVANNGLRKLPIFLVENSFSTLPPPTVKACIEYMCRLADACTNERIQQLNGHNREILTFLQNIRGMVKSHPELREYISQPNIKAGLFILNGAISAPTKGYEQEYEDKIKKARELFTSTQGTKRRIRWFDVLKPGHDLLS